MTNYCCRDVATMSNEARLRELAVREAHISRVEAEVQDRLLQRNQDRRLYKSLMLELIVQGLYRVRVPCTYLSALFALCFTSRYPQFAKNEKFNQTFQLTKIGQTLFVQRPNVIYIN